MKDNLMLKKYATEVVKGSFNLLEEKSFFGSKVMDVEDEISITDISTQYFQYYYDVTDSTNLIQIEKAKNNGYQYQVLNTYQEKIYLLDVVQLKNDNHTITTGLQSKVDKIHNTKWEINIDIKNILTEYLFSKIKESRTFKSLSYDYFSNNNINKSIYEYISNNLLDRYEFSNIDFYVKYISIKNNIYSNFTLKQFDPMFNQVIELPEYKISNVNIVNINNLIDKLVSIELNYFQTKSSSEYKFDWYYNLHFKKI